MFRPAFDGPDRADAGEVARRYSTSGPKKFRGRRPSTRRLPMAVTAAVVGAAHSQLPAGSEELGAVLRLQPGCGVRNQSARAWQDNPSLRSTAAHSSARLKARAASASTISSLAVRKSNCETTSLYQRDAVAESPAGVFLRTRSWPTTRAKTSFGHLMRARLGGEVYRPLDPGIDPPPQVLGAEPELLEGAPVSTRRGGTGCLWGLRGSPHGYPGGQFQGPKRLGKS